MSYDSLTWKAIWQVEFFPVYGNRSVRQKEGRKDMVYNDMALRLAELQRQVDALREEINKQGKPLKGWWVVDVSPPTHKIIPVAFLGTAASLVDDGGIVKDHKNKTHGVSGQNNYILWGTFLKEGF